MTPVRNDDLKQAKQMLLSVKEAYTHFTSKGWPVEHVNDLIQEWTTDFLSLLNEQSTDVV